MNKIKLMGENIIMGFDLIWPVGVTYTQYPGQKSPMDMWGEFSTWEVVKYGGAFFRTEGGNAKDFLEPMPATTSDGLEFTVDWASIPDKDQDLFVLSKNFNIGDFVAVDGEFREIKEVKDAGGTWITTAKGETDAWSGIYGFKVDAAFTEPEGGYQNITKVVVLQEDALQNITGDFSLSNNVNYGSPIGSCDGAFIGTGLSRIGLDSGDWGDRASDISFDASRVARTSNETRSINSTYRIWKRIN